MIFGRGFSNFLLECLVPEMRIELMIPETNVLALTTAALDHLINETLTKCA
jgi:hypothetical protein